MYDPVTDGIEKTVQSVRYLAAKPPSHLSELVHSFWEIKTVHPLSYDFQYHILPDACVNILLDQTDPKIAAVTALHTISKVLNLGRAFHYVGIQFLPGVWRGAPDEIIRGFVDKPYSGKLPLIRTNRNLAGLDFYAKQVVLAKLTEQFIHDNLVAANSVTAAILANIENVHSVADMAALTHMSPRHLQRTLKRTTGFSPHDLLKVLRLQQSFKEDYLAYYADQSHFIHSFRKLTGYTPSSYTKRFNV
jgi:AraC-like DNA-binding protein